MEKKVVLSSLVARCLLKEFARHENREFETVTGFYLEADEELTICLPCLSGMKKICLPPLPRMLFLFFLLHPEGIFISRLDRYKEELTSLYTWINRNGKRKYDVCKVVDNLVDISTKRFYETISQIRSVLIKMIGKEDAGNFCIVKSADGKHRIKAAVRNLRGIPA